MDRLPVRAAQQQKTGALSGWLDGQDQVSERTLVLPAT